MHKSLFAAAGMALLGLSQPASAFGGLTEAGELEHARANARAGGPVSERDAELLERWGCTSGTQNEVCERRDDRVRHVHHRHRRDIERY